jgi:hypothetical protein
MIIFPENKMQLPFNYRTTLYLAGTQTHQLFNLNLLQNWNSFVQPLELAQQAGTMPESNKSRAPRLPTPINAPMLIADFHASDQILLMQIHTDSIPKPKLRSIATLDHESL